MKKLIAISLVALFAVAFGLGVLATPAHAFKQCPSYATGCWWECVNGYWQMCYYTPGGLVMCELTLDECP